MPRHTELERAQVVVRREGLMQVGVFQSWPLVYMRENTEFLTTATLRGWKIHYLLDTITSYPDTTSVSESTVKLIYGPLHCLLFFIHIQHSLQSFKLHKGSWRREVGSLIIVQIWLISFPNAISVIHCTLILSKIFYIPLHYLHL